jgi:hypothetical protein
MGSLYLHLLLRQFKASVGISIIPSTIYSNIYISYIVIVRQTKSNGSCKGQDKVFSQFHPAYWQFDFWWRYFQDTRRKTLDLYSINIEDEFVDKLKNFFLKISEPSCCDIIFISRIHAIECWCFWWNTPKHFKQQTIESRLTFPSIGMFASE